MQRELEEDISTGEEDLSFDEAPPADRPQPPQPRNFKNIRKEAAKLKKEADLCEAIHQSLLTHPKLGRHSSIMSVASESQQWKGDELQAIQAKGEKRVKS